MTVEEYQQYKKDNNWKELYFNYWQDCKGKYADIAKEDFTEMFKGFLDIFEGKAFITAGGPKRIEVSKIQAKILAYYDTKYKI